MMSKKVFLSTILLCAGLQSFVYAMHFKVAYLILNSAKTLSGEPTGCSLACGEIQERYIYATALYCGVAMKHAGLSSDLSVLQKRELGSFFQDPEKAELLVRADRFIRMLSLMTVLSIKLKYEKKTGMLIHIKKGLPPVKVITIKDMLKLSVEANASQIAMGLLKKVAELSATDRSLLVSISQSKFREEWLESIFKQHSEKSLLGINCLRFLAKITDSDDLGEALVSSVGSMDVSTEDHGSTDSLREAPSLACFAEFEDDNAYEEPREADETETMQVAASGSENPNEHLVDEQVMVTETGDYVVVVSAGMEEEVSSAASSERIAVPNKTWVSTFTLGWW